jgi:hypothetical protein
MENSLGNGGDITVSTRQLWDYVHRYGLDPHGGNIDRSENPFTRLSSISTEEAHQLSMVERDIEDQLVKDLLKEHPAKWYKDKILAFARAGKVSEKDFYKILAYPWPGKSSTSFGNHSMLRSAFSDHVEQFPPEVLRAMSFRQGIGSNGHTAVENLDRATEQISDFLKQRLHSGTLSGGSTPRECLTKELLTRVK